MQRKKCRLNNDDIALAKRLGLNPRSSERVMKLDPIVFELLQEYRTWQDAEKKLLGDRWCAIVPIKHSDDQIELRDNDRLFTSLEGLPMNPDSLTD